MPRSLGLFFLAFAACLSGAAAQDKQDDSCQIGPDCVAADQAAQKRIAGWSALMAGQPSTHIASMVAYCTNDAVAKTAERCQTELQSMASTLTSPTAVNKKKACLTLAEQARQEAERSDKLAAAALRNAYDSAASSSWQPDCTNIKVRVPHAGKWLFTSGPTSIWTTMDASGNVIGTTTLSDASGTRTFTLQGTASESGVSLTSSGTHSNPERFRIIGVTCSGQRSGNGYAGTCTLLSPSQTSWAFQLIPQ